MKADGFLRMAQGSAQEAIRAKAIFGTTSRSRLGVHSCLKSAASTSHRIHARG